MPRLYLGPQFGSTGTSMPIVRYDPDVLVSPNRREVFLIAGNSDTVEDAFVVRNVGISAAGTVNKSVVNVSGFATSKRLRPPTPGGHGQGRRAAFSPDGKRVAFLSADGITFQSRMDFLNIASTNGLDYGQVKPVYADANGKFKHLGALGVERAVMGLRWLDDDRVAFLMGRSPYDDPFGTIGSFTPGVDLFVYDRTTDVMTNVTGTDGSASGFDAYGTINPAGYFGSPSGQFSYLLDFGEAGAGSALPAGTPVRDVVGIEHASASDFRLAGALGSLVPHLALPQSECLRPVETPAAMRFVEGHGVQQGMLYFTAHVKDGNAGDELMALNRDAPFVALQATFSAKPDTLLSNVSPSASSGKVAFARTDTSATNAANQHPFVVDLDHFLFERDVLPTWTTPGGGFLGRVMDGSLHIVPPQGGAGEGLVLGFGLTALPSLGTAHVAVPAYYPLATVSNPLAEPIPVVIPLIDTLLLGADFRFYVPFAAPSQSD
jgi:hypothetical protein